VQIVTGYAGTGEAAVDLSDQVRNPFAFGRAPFPHLALPLPPVFYLSTTWEDLVQIVTGYAETGEEVVDLSDQVCSPPPPLGYPPFLFSVPRSTPRRAGSDCDWLRRDGRGGGA
jgi:hypothetical protein